MNKQLSELINKIDKGLKLSFARLLEEAKKKDDYLIFSINGKIVKVKAKDINISS
jgi:hypothetical protein